MDKPLLSKVAISSNLKTGLLLILFGWILPTETMAQAPVISYNSTNVFIKRTAITSLTPTNSGTAVTAPGYNTTTTMVGSGYGAPLGVAADAAGDVYVADQLNAEVVEIPAGGGGPVNITGFTGGPMAVAVDAAKDLFVADNTGTIYE